MSEIIDKTSDIIVEDAEENNVEVEEELPEFIKYMTMLFNILIDRDENTGIYFLDPFYLFYMNKFDLFPFAKGFENVSIDEIKEILSLEVTRRNASVNNVYKTIQTLKNGLENIELNENNVANINDIVKAVSDAAEKQNKNSKGNKSQLGRLDFSKRK